MHYNSTLAEKSKTQIRDEMTSTARIVLSDCEETLKELTDCCGDEGKFRRRWVNFVALIRAVGHVLKEVDAKKSRKLRRAIDDQYEKDKESQMFKGFIARERNLVLKEYSTEAKRLIWGTGVSSLTGVIPKSGQTVTIHSAGGNAPELHLRAFIDGPFAGCKQLDVAAQAVEWWRSHLDKIDARVSSSSP